MSRFQGIGNTYYGKTDYNTEDNSYITTEWFTILLLPIFPRKSLRVIKLGKQEKSHYMIFSMGYSHTVTYKILEQISIKNNLRQIKKTYLFAYGFLALFIASCFLAGINYLFIWIPFTFLAGLFVFALIKSE